MKYDVTLERIANCYYNLGLERAKLRDLSGAAELLKKALHYDKYQREARNLLGLIFFEMGEVADALVQWVISMNLLPEENPADYYLDEIQRKPAILRICSDNVKRFNQALDYAQHNNKDLAVFQLNQVISDSPNYVKAHILLALLYMDRGDWIKAGKSLYLVLKIDRNNPKALVLMDLVKKNTGRAEIEQSKLKNVFSHRKMTDDDVMMPQEIRQLSPWSVSLLLLLGTGIGLFVFYLLMLPAGIRSANAKNNQELIAYTEKLDAANQKLSNVEAEKSKLQKSYDDAKANLDRYENQNASFMAQYQSLVNINNALSTGDILAAAEAYTKLDQSSITDSSLQNMLNTVKSQMEGNVYLRLQEMGTAAWNAGKTDEALQYFTWSVKIRREAENLFLLARLQQSMGNTTEANQNFDSVVGEFPSSPYAERARSARGY
ncbi:MAG: tetratricopeptide repeat protein [Lachnospiraceae bacterium]|nr:tetratricopeptide repeat protein [Lachnospiraceae bacterium]